MWTSDAESWGVEAKRDEGRKVWNNDAEKKYGREEEGKRRVSTVKSDAGEWSGGAQPGESVAKCGPAVHKRRMERTKLKKRGGIVRCGRTARTSGTATDELRQERQRVLKIIKIRTQNTR